MCSEARGIKPQDEVGAPWASADSVHKVFSSTFETIPTRRGEDPFRIAEVDAIGAGIHAIRAGRH